MALRAPLDDDFVQGLQYGRWFETPLARQAVGVGKRRAPRRRHGAVPSTPAAPAKPAPAPKVDDRDGLDAAYATDENVVVRGNDLFISGTKHADSLVSIMLNPATAPEHWMNGDLDDVWDDVTKIPLQLTRYAKRYREAEPILLSHPEITRVVGHSLGGSVTLELAKNHPERNLETVTYGAPVLTFQPDGGKRYRHPGDPISMLDWGATNEPNATMNPHEYGNFAADRA